MTYKNLYAGLKFVFLGCVLLPIALFLFSPLRETTEEARHEAAYKALPNYNYIPEIKTLKKEGNLSEAQELARFVLRHPDMPGQDEARILESELETEIHSLWGKTKRATKGFVMGSGSSIEELSGGIAADMIIYGDVRDLFKQGYYIVTGKETDPVIATLAGIGLLTEAVDLVDWAPAVLKAFRKIGALSQRFADFVLTAMKKSVKGGKLDGTLKTSLENLACLTDKMGLARTSTVFKHVDDPADLAAITAVAQKNVDAAYFTVKNGGTEGVFLIKSMGDTDAGIAKMAQAAKKGPAGIQWLKRGGGGHKYVLGTRFGARLLKNLRLDRFQQLITELAKRYSGLRNALWFGLVLVLLASCFSFVQAGRKFLQRGK